MRRSTCPCSTAFDTPRHLPLNLFFMHCFIGLFDGQQSNRSPLKRAYCGDRMMHALRRFVYATEDSATVSYLVARRERHKLDVRRRDGIIAEGPLHSVEVVRPDGHQRAASANVLVQLVLRVTAVRGGHSTHHIICYIYKGVKHPTADCKPSQQDGQSTSTTRIPLPSTRYILYDACIMRLRSTVPSSLQEAKPQSLQLNQHRNNSNAPSFTL